MLIMNRSVSIPGFLITYLQPDMRPVKVMFLIELGQVHSMTGFHKPVWIGWMLSLIPQDGKNDIYFLQVYMPVDTDLDVTKKS